jgi:hypothetical protein
MQTTQPRARTQQAPRRRSRHVACFPPKEDADIFSFSRREKNGAAKRKKCFSGRGGQRNGGEGSTSNVWKRCAQTVPIVGQSVSGRSNVAGRTVRVRRPLSAAGFAAAAKRPRRVAASSLRARTCGAFARRPRVPRRSRLKLAPSSARHPSAEVGPIAPNTECSCAERPPAGRALGPSARPLPAVPSI